MFLRPKGVRKIRTLTRNFHKSEAISILIFKVVEPGTSVISVRPCWSENELWTNKTSFRNDQSYNHLFVTNRNITSPVAQCGKMSFQLHKFAKKYDVCTCPQTSNIEYYLIQNTAEWTKRHVSNDLNVLKACSAKICSTKSAVCVNVQVEKLLCHCAYVWWGEF